VVVIDGSAKIYFPLQMPIDDRTQARLVFSQDPCSLSTQEIELLDVFNDEAPVDGAHALEAFGVVVDHE
jgi:hypothetical protein